MFQKVKNIVHVNVEGVKLTTLKNIEFYVRQGGLFFSYVPSVISDEEMKKCVDDYLERDEI